MKPHEIRYAISSVTTGVMTGVIMVMLINEQNVELIV